jgi:hypothetical protein
VCQVTERWRPLASAPLDGTTVIICAKRVVGEASYWESYGWLWAGASPLTQQKPAEPDLWCPMPEAP